MTVCRAITIREPWCSAVVDGVKPVENRRRGFPLYYRGLVLAHSSLKWSERGAEDPRILIEYEPDPALFVFGAVIGQVDLADVHPDTGCCRPWGESEYVEKDGTVVTGLIHLVFEDAQRYGEPVPARGALGLWQPSLELLRACLL